MRDYAKKYSSPAVKRQKVSGKPTDGPEGNGLFKVIGVITVVAMLLGVASSFWLGAALQNELGRLDKGRLERTELALAKVALSVEKEALLKEGKIESAAGELGLFPPSRQQLRRP
jgi:hypothetical protein